MADFIKIWQSDDGSLVLTVGKTTQSLWLSEEHGEYEIPLTDNDGQSLYQALGRWMANPIHES